MKNLRNICFNSISLFAYYIRHFNGAQLAIPLNPASFSSYSLIFSYVSCGNILVNVIWTEDTYFWDSIVAAQTMDRRAKMRTI
jgi:hypothetical protein